MVALQHRVVPLCVLIAALLLVYAATTAHAQPKAAPPDRFPEPRFEHLGLKDGLPENSVRCILQDRFGYLWLGTQNGLVKYDGYSMTVYESKPDNPGSIADNTIWAIHEDRAGTLWVGTYFGGLMKFDRRTETFTRYLNDPSDSTSISSNRVECIYEDKADRLWVGTSDGLCLLDRMTGKFTRHYQQDSLYGPEVYEYLSGLEKAGRQIGSIVKVGDNANISKSFFLKQKTEILLVAMGEGTLDYGWLESEDGMIIARSDSNKTRLAGGRSDNRVLMSTKTLEAGKYRIHYKSDDIHAYGKWSGEPPSHPEFWGIQLFDISGETEEVRRMFDVLYRVNLRTYIYAVIDDQPTGKLFVGMSRPGLWTFTGETNGFSKHSLSDADNVISTGSIHAFHRARDGTLWITSSRGLSRYNGQTNYFKSYQVVSSQQYTEEDNLGSLLEDPTGLIWVGTYRMPVLQCFDPQSEQFHNYSHDSNNPHGLSFSHGIFSLYEDQSGVFWVGHWSGGLDKWDRKKQRFNTLENDPGSLAQGGPCSLYEDRAGGILIGTDEGVVRLDMGTPSPFRYPYPYRRDKNHRRNRISGFIEDPIERGVLWISSRDSGLVRFDSEKGVSTHYRNDPRDGRSLISNDILEVRMDHEGALWIGTNAGLNRFDRATGKFTVFRHDPNDSNSISENGIRGIYEDRAGILWIGTNTGGLNRFDRTTGRFTSYRSLVAGRAFTASWRPYEDRHGNFWVGDYMSGLHLFDRNNGKSIRDFTEKDGLANSSIPSILEDGSGHLWISTLNGLSRLDPQTQTFKSFRVEDGLLENFFWPSHLKTRDGRIILGSPKGLIVFHPDSIKDDPIPPRVLITSVSLFNRSDEKLALNGYVPELKEIILAHNQNDLRFDYVGLQFSEPARNRYKYVLENFDRDWVDAGTQRNATYTNLDPGEYAFKVKAANRDGIWNEEGASIRIVITPPWWKTIWAYLGYGFAIVGVLYSIRRTEKRRDRQKQQAELERVESEKRLQQEFSKQLIETQEAERKRVASELHDSLGQHLLIVNNEIQLYLQSEERKDADLRRTASVVKDSIKEVREIASNLHPHHLEKLGLRAAVEAMIEQISRSAPVKFNVAIADVDSKLNMQAKINLYRVLQEAIANIVRHSGATQASVTVSQADNTVQAIIEDNGKGFVQSSSQGGRQGFGLKSMTERMNLVGGTITFDSSPDKGTTIRITIPLQS